MDKQQISQKEKPKSSRDRARAKATERLKAREGKSPKREIDAELDRLEKQIAELRVMFEQYFVDVIPLPPEENRKAIVKEIKRLLKSPFKTQATKFRLRTLVTRYQTYHTYWERVLKQREEGTYHRDLFKADLRDKIIDETRREQSTQSAAEKSFHQLYNSYETALKKVGAKTENLNFETFKKSLIKRAQQLKKEKGVKGLRYKVVVRDGKVVVKASVR